MSASEETLKNASVNLSVKPAKAKESVFSQFLKLLCSVRFGVILLILLALACLVGMLIMQQNVDGFENYYAQLTPAQRLVYGRLGFFDIYHSWYFNALLAVLSLNIILASIDRFPKTWLAAKPKIDPPVRWLREQKQTLSFSAQAARREEVVNRIADACRQSGWRKTVIKEKGERTFVFAESGRWNRFGAYAVHVGLLTIFLGGFMTTQLGQNGQMPLAPGETSSEISDIAFNLDQIQQVTKRVPFEVICTDIQQKLIRNDESIKAGNTLDWLTRIKIKDETGETEAVVQMNRPFDYRGYRFFQSSFVATGRARSITVQMTPAAAAAGAAPQNITIPRDGAATLPDGTHVKFANFRANFSLGPENPNEDTSGYPNPGAVLQVTPPGGEKPLTAYAFGAKMADIPAAKNPVGGYTYRLVDFEKVSDRHILAVQYDPGATVVYVGFGLLCLTLVGVFFFSHQRVWAAIEETAENNFEVVVGGHTNRNQTGFEEKFNRFAAALGGQFKETKS